MQKVSLVCFVAILVYFSHVPTGFAKTFKSEHLSKQIIQAMRQGNTLKDDSPVPPERLRLLTIQHIDFEGKEKTGQMIVLDVCDEAVLAIFKELYERRFPIQQVRLMHHYAGDDHAAVTDNNTSCYVDRQVIGDQQKKSLHAYGVAIDLNPVQNPFISIEASTGIATYEPKAGIAYANRRLERLGKAARKGMAEEVVDLFAAHGFYWWGGYWDMPLDYQHFQLSKGMAELYLVMDPQTAKSTFQQATRYYNRYKQPLEQILLERLQNKYQLGETLAACYQKDEKLFQQVLEALTQK